MSSALVLNMAGSREFTAVQFAAGANFTGHDQEILFRSGRRRHGNNAHLVVEIEVADLIEFSFAI